MKVENNHAIRKKCHEEGFIATSTLSIQLDVILFLRMLTKLKLCLLTKTFIALYFR